MSATRFVILHHRHPDGEHWDLMIERESVLATWRLERQPADCPADAIDATPLPDHRKHYLEYEGPVSGNRGTVERVEAGVCAVLAADARAWRVRFEGARVTGEYTIADDGRGRWTWRPA